MKSDERVPLIDLKGQYAQIRSEIDAAIRNVIESQQFVMGAEVEAFETEFAAYTGARHALGCASGSDALLLAFMALGIGPGDEVICPSYTFFGTAGSIARLGAVPVFADIDPATFNLCPVSVRQSAAPLERLRAIVPVHLFGRAAKMEELQEIANDLGVALIEDAAQAAGTRDSTGRMAGSLCEIGCFSFYPSKNLGAYGDAGMLTTSDDSLAERLRSLRDHGASRPYEHASVGLNSRLDALQAAVLRVKLRHLENWNQKRRANAALYDEAFTKAGAGVDTLSFAGSRLPLLLPAPTAPPALHSYHHYVVRVPEASRDALRAYLNDRGIATAVYYPVPLDMQACFSHLPSRPAGLPHAERAALQSLALPIEQGLADAQLTRVVEVIVDFFERHAPAAGLPIS